LHACTTHMSVTLVPKLYGRCAATDTPTDHGHTLLRFAFFMRIPWSLDHTFSPCITFGHVRSCMRYGFTPECCGVLSHRQSTPISYPIHPPINPAHKRVERFGLWSQAMVPAATICTPRCVRGYDCSTRILAICVTLHFCV
jgi:hypothetical protein